MLRLPAKKREFGPFGLMRQALHSHAARLAVTDTHGIEIPLYRNQCKLCTDCTIVSLFYVFYTALTD